VHYVFGKNKLWRFKTQQLILGTGTGDSLIAYKIQKLFLTKFFLMKNDPTYFLLHGSSSSTDKRPACDPDFEAILRHPSNPTIFRRRFRPE